MIQAKIDEALEALFDQERNDDNSSKYLDSLFMLGQLFLNK